MRLGSSGLGELLGVVWELWRSESMAVGREGGGGNISTHTSKISNATKSTEIILQQHFSSILHTMYTDMHTHVHGERLGNII